MIRSKLGGQDVVIHDTASLDVSEFLRWADQTRMLGFDNEGLAFDHEDRVNHYGPLSGRWLRLCQFADDTTAWNLDPLNASHLAAVKRVLANRWHHLITWGSFDAEASSTVLGIDVTANTYSGMTLANMLRPGKTESHGLKDWAARYDMPELRAAEEVQEAKWAELRVPAPRKPVRPRRRQSDTDDTHARRLFEWRTTALERWHREVEEHYRQYPRREDDRFTPSGGFKSGWSEWRDLSINEPWYQEYAGLDPMAARRLWPILVNAVKERGLSKPLGREVALEQAMTRVKLRGTLTDSQYATDRLSVIKPRHEAAKASFEELTGVKATSPKRVGWLRDRGFQFNPKAVTKSGEPSLSGQHVTDYLAAYAPDHEGGPPQGVSAEVYRALELIKEAGSTQNLTTFLGGLVAMTDPRGRIHPGFNVLGAETGRWTARNPAVQTFSNKNGTRGIIIPEPGHVLVSIDQAQIEVRVFAAKSGCQALIDAFNNGEDIYGVVAQRLFGNGWAKRERSLCKRIILGGCLYGGGAATLQSQLHDLDGEVFKLQDIVDTRNQFYSTYPEGRRYIRRMNSPDDVWLDSGRFVPGDPERPYRGTNSACQGEARDLIVDTLMRCFAMGYESALRLVCHDEGIFSLPVDGLAGAIADLYSCFHVPYRGVNVDADIEVYSDRWGGEMQPWEVVNGVARPRSA